MWRLAVKVTGFGEWDVAPTVVTAEQAMAIMRFLKRAHPLAKVKCWRDRSGLFSVTDNQGK